MNKLKVLSILIILAVLLSLAGPTFGVSARPLALGTSPTLGAVGSYSVLGHTTVTNTGPTTMPGDLGISIGGAPTGFPPGVVGPPGAIRNAADSLAAQNANTAAFTFLDQPCDAWWTGLGNTELGGMNLVPGVYCADSFSLTGVLTLSGGAGDVYIFKSASTLITAAGSSVVGGDPCNIWWRVASSATLGTTTSFIGNILALTSIAMQTGATINGRTLAQTGAVTLDTNTFTGPVCAVAPVVPPVVPPVVVPPVEGLPATGGAPIRNEAFPWSLVIPVAGLSAMALFFWVRGTRRNRIPKQ